MGSSGCIVCSSCGARAVVMTSAPLDMGDGLTPTIVHPDFDYEHCNACGEDFIPADRLDELFREAVSHERAQAGLLASEQIRDLRLRLGLTQRRLEAMLGVSPKTVTRWENGTVRQSQMADNFMRLLDAHPELVGERCAVQARESRGPYRPRGR